MDESKHTYTTTPNRGWAWVLLLGILAVGCGKQNTPDTYGGSTDGLYPIADGTPTGQLKKNKIAEFDRLPRGWESSVATVLRDHTLGASIESNKTSGLPDAALHQRYNYVVQELNGQNEILVATWSFPGKQLRDKVDFDAICGPTGRLVYSGATLEYGAMVNFWPEDQTLPDTPPPPRMTPILPPPLNSANACTSESMQKSPSELKSVGVMDAHSKHFMLAQGRGTTLGNYSAQTQAKWTGKLVKYAGEIIVDVKNCTYLINQGSGTYWPHAGTVIGTYDHLKKIAQLFAEKVRAAPNLLWNTKGISSGNTQPFTSSASTVVPGCKPSS